MRTLTHLTPHVGTDAQPAFRPLVPLAVEAMPALIAADQDKAAEAMELFDELFESEVAVVVPHIRPIVELCLRVAGETGFSDSLRSRAIAFLGRLARYKKKTIVKQKL